MNNSVNKGRPKDTAKRTAILEASAVLFTQHGFDGTSMDLVAQTAGVSKQTVYSHFSGKEALFAAAVELFSERIIPANIHKPDPDAPIGETLMTIGMGSAGIILSDVAVAVHKMVSSGSPDAPRLAKLFYDAGPKKTIERMAAIFTELDSQGKLAIEDPYLAVHQFISLIKGETYFMRTLGLRGALSQPEMKKHVGQCVDAFLKIYRI